MANKNVLSLRMPAEAKAWLKLRAALHRRSLNAEVLALLEQFRSNDDCTEVEVRKDRGLYVVKSRHTGETFGRFMTKGLAMLLARDALEVAGFDPAGVHDATRETEAA